MYKLHIFGKQIKFIDTPGFNDTENGKDEENYLEIIRFLSNFD